MHYYIAAIILISTLAKGGFDSTTGLFLGLLICGGLLFSHAVIPPFRLTLIFSLVCLIYLLSVIVNQFAVENLIVATKPLVCLLFLVLIYSLKDRLYPGSLLLISALITAAIGLISFIGLIEFDGMVTAGRLQSTFQYANAAGIVFAAAALLTDSKDFKQYRPYALILELALILSQSVGAIIVYLFCRCFCLYFEDKNKRTARAGAFSLRFIISALIAAALYVLVYILKLPLAAIPVLVLVGLLPGKLDQLTAKLGSSLKINILAASGFVFVNLMFFSLRGPGFYHTFVERLIQISDALGVVISKPLLGLGPGLWQHTRFAWQSADYQATYIHSSLLQVAVDTGLPGLAATALLGIYCLRKFKRHQVYLYAAMLAIFLHSLFDLTMNFLGVVFFLPILYRLYSEEEGRPVKQVKPLYLVPATVFAYLLVVQALFNLAVIELGSGDYGRSIRSLERIEPYHYNSYEIKYMLAELYFIEGKEEKLTGQLQKLPYQTAESHFLKGYAEKRRGDSKAALEFVFKGIEQSLHQAEGYRLAGEIIANMTPDKSAPYLSRLGEYQKQARREKHPLAYIIEKEVD